MKHKTSKTVWQCTDHNVHTGDAQHAEHNAQSLRKHCKNHEAKLQQNAIPVWRAPLQQRKRWHVHKRNRKTKNKS